MAVEPRTHVCAGCGLELPGAVQLERHMRKYCIGSALHERTRERMGASSSSVGAAPQAAQLERASAFLQGGAPGGRDVEQMTLADLRISLLAERSREAQAAEDAKRWVRIDEEGKGRKLRLEQVALFEAGEAQVAELEALELELREQRALALDAKAERLRALRELETSGERRAPPPALQTPPAGAHTAPAPSARGASLADSADWAASSRLGAAALGGSSLAATLPPRRPLRADAPAPSAVVAERQLAIAARRRAMEAAAAKEAAALEHEAAALGARRAALALARDGGGRFPFSLDASAPADRPRSSASDAGRAYFHEAQRGARARDEQPPPTPPDARLASPLGGDAAAMARELLAEADELERTYLARGGHDPKVLRAIGELRAEAAALFAMAAGGGRAGSPASSPGSRAERHTPPRSQQQQPQPQGWGSPPPPWEQPPPPQPRPPPEHNSWGAPPWAQPPPQPPPAAAADPATEMLQQHLTGLQATLDRQEMHAARVREALAAEVATAAERGPTTTMRRGPSLRGDSLDELLGRRAEPPPPPQPPLPAAAADDPAAAPPDLRRQLDVDRLELERLKIRHEAQMATLVFEKERLEMEAMLRATQLATQQPVARQVSSRALVPGSAASPTPSDHLLPPRGRASTASLPADEHPTLSGQKYDGRTGFSILFDSVEQLPARASSIRLAYALYEADTQRSAVRPLPFTACERAPTDGGGYAAGVGAKRGGSARAHVGLRRDFPAMEASASTLVLIEVQQLLPAEPGAEPPTRSLGWTVVRPFSAAGAFDGGYWLCGLVPPPLDPSAAAVAILGARAADGAPGASELLPPPAELPFVALRLARAADAQECEDAGEPPPSHFACAPWLQPSSGVVGSFRGAGSFGGASRRGAEAEEAADDDAEDGRSFGRRADSSRVSRAAGAAVTAHAAAQRGLTELAPIRLLGFAPAEPEPFMAEADRTGRAPLAVRVTLLAGGGRVGAPAWLSARGAIAGDGSWVVHWPVSEGATLAIPPGVEPDGAQAPCALVELIALGGGDGGGAADFAPDGGDAASAPLGSLLPRRESSRAGRAPSGAQALTLAALLARRPSDAPTDARSPSPPGAADADDAVVIGWAVVALLRQPARSDSALQMAAAMVAVRQAGVNGAAECVPFVGTRTVALRPPPVASQLALATAAACIEAAASPLGDVDASAQSLSASSTPRAGAAPRLTIALRPPRSLAQPQAGAFLRKLQRGRPTPVEAHSPRSPQSFRVVAAAEPFADARPAADGALRPAAALSAIASEPSASARSEPAPQPNGLPTSIWTRGHAQPPPVAQFESGDGLDVYIDGLIGVPDSVAAPRLEAGVITRDGARVPVTGAGGDLSVRGQPRPSADAFAPRIQLRLELREARFDPTSTLVITVVGVHARERTPVVVGRVAFPLFALLDEAAAAAALAAGERVPRRQPDDPLARSFAANYGAFQLRVYGERGAPARPRADADAGVFKAIGGARPVPGLSVLIRVAPAPQTADGLGLLSAEDVPEAEHEALGLRIRAPDYSSGAYDGTAATPTAQELSLLQTRARQRASRADTVRDRLRIAVSTPGGAEAPPEKATENELGKWAANVLDQALNSRAPPLPFALNTAFTFSRARGIAVTVLRAGNLPNAALSAALLSIAPPGALYRVPPRADESVHLVTDLELASELRAPQWRTAPHVFRARAFPPDADDALSDLPHAALVVDLRSLPKPTAPRPTVDLQGWAVLPLFEGPGYVASGVYRLPLYAYMNGSGPSPTLLDAISTEGAEPALARALRDRRIKLIDGASVDVGLLDEVRVGEWEHGFLPAVDMSALNQVCGGDSRKLDRYTPSRQSKPAHSVFADRMTPAMVRAKFESALGLN